MKYKYVARLKADQKDTRRHMRSRLMYVQEVEGKELPEGVTISSWYPTRFKINKLSDLPKVRKFLREIFGTWGDKIGYIQSSGKDTGYVTYSSTDKNNPFTIEFTFLKAETPKEFTNNGHCGWKTTMIQASMCDSFVCGVNQ